MASRCGLKRFRDQWKAGRPSRAAIQWAAIKGYADAEGNLTPRGVWWFGLGGSARKPVALNRIHKVREAGGSRAWQALQARLLFPRRPLLRRSQRGAVPAEGSAQRGSGSGKGLREGRPDASTGHSDHLREWAARQERDRARVDRGRPASFWRDIRAINAQRNGL